MHACYWCRKVGAGIGEVSGGGPPGKRLKMWLSLEVWLSTSVEVVKVRVVWAAVRV